MVKKDRLGMTRRDHQSLDVAKLYYSGLSQSEIANILHVSRPNVSKLLTHAKARGFVKIRIDDPREQDRELIGALRSAFSLDEIRLVSPPRRRDIDIRKALGRAGADLFMGLVRDGDTVGVYWSRTIQSLTASLHGLEFQRVNVVQLGGQLEMPSMDLSMMNSFRELEQYLQATVHMLGYPIVLQSASEKLAIEREETVSGVMELARRARIVLYSVGSVSSVATLLHSPLINEDEREFLIEHSVGEICAHFIDEDGRVCLPDLNNRTLGISLPDLRHNEQKILIAGGSDKLQVVYAALLRGYANRLVIDTVTARKLHALTKKKQGK
ncbi:sugar-binding transcriptional regulator [uncultured Varibaculum sp.]|uniref:sugar-binding transcriptional regulator n=1 Tax=uncultured Varibaculum sp. TaxID=413896 RepID=UPI002597D8EA|nr:sugar-binding domain-containing protein [uncultured Varibaculum sp.]